MRNFIEGILALVLIVLPVRPAQQTSPQPIAYGQSVSGELITTRPEALYIFAAQQGDVLSVAMEVTGGTLDPLVILVDESQQTVLGVGNDSGGNHIARLRFVIPASANYILKATAVQGSGEINGRYRLTIALGNPTPTPSPITNAPLIAPLQPGESVQGDLSDAVRFHLYAIRAQRSDPITAVLEIAGNAPAGLYLYTPDFREIGRAELGGALNTQAPADGLYFLMVARAATSGTGTYTLRYGAASGPSGMTITPGQTVQGTITTSSAVKTYSLQGAAGQSVIARLRRLSGDLAVYLYVVALDSGQMLSQATGSNGIAQLNVTLPAAGTYAIVATRDGKQNGTTTGSYALTVKAPGDTAPVPAAFRGYSPLQYGDRVSGKSDDTAYATPYVFAGETGDIVDATATVPEGSTLAPYLILQNANGDTIAESGVNTERGTAHLQTRLVQPGYYGLIATRAGLAKGKSQGAFDLSLTVLDPAQASGRSGDGIALVAGQAQAGAIGPQIAGLYRFEAQANMSVTLDASPAAGLDVVTILADSSFQQIGQVGQAAAGPVLIAQAGTYYVLVVRRGGPNDPVVGGYSVVLQGRLNPAPTATPAPLVYGQPVSGSLSREVYQTRYLLDVQQGATLIITMEAAPGSALDPMVALLDANNNLLAVNDNASPGTRNAALIYEVTQTGRCTVLATRAQEAAGTTSGAYTLKVELSQAKPTLAATPNTITGTASASTNDPIPIQYGATISGTISAQRPLYYYTFDGSAGDVISIQMNRVSGSDLEPLLYLYVYNGSKLAPITSKPGNPDAALTQFKLPQQGRYLIVATRAGATQGKSQGGFTLTLKRNQ